jgi:probable HAF family extracellular repeat protein
MKSRTWMWMTVVYLFAALAMPVWMAAQDNPSQDHKPKHQQYKLIDLGTLGGPTSSAPLYQKLLNNPGMVSGCADTAVSDPNYPNFNPILSGGPNPNIFHAFQGGQGGITDLGALPGVNSSCGFWVSDSGLVAGASENGAIDALTGWPEIRATLWKNGEIINLGNFGGNESMASGVNNRGQVVGFATNTIPDQNSGFGTQIRAFLWEKGVMRDLSTLGGPDTPDAFAAVNNERGQILGISFGGGPPNGTFLWSNGTTQYVIDAFGGTDTSPFYLNNRGMIVGHAGLPGDLTVHPYLWYKGVMMDLGTFGGDNGEAVWANDEGEVIGTADLPGDVAHHGFLWRHGAKTDIAPVHNDTCTRVWEINESSQVVGNSSDCVTAHSAILWEKGESLDLNQLVPPNSGVTLILAADINDRGEIIAQGVLSNGDSHVILLIPDGDCDSDCEGRIAASQNSAAPAQNVVTMKQGDESPINPVERLRSQMRHRYHLPGQTAAPRD